MFESLKIQNFRRLENFKVNRLGRLNLIIGKNNTGKSSILEAMYVYANRGDLSILEKIVEQRDEHLQFSENNADKLAIMQFLAIFSGRNYFDGSPVPIVVGELNNPENVYSFQPIFYKSEITEEVATQKFEGKSSISLNDIAEAWVNVSTTKDIGKDTKLGFQIRYGSEKPFIKSLDGFMDFLSLFNQTEKNNIPCQYIPSSGISNEKAAELWDKISLTDDEENINKILKVIDKNITKITFKGKSTKTPFIRLKGMKDPVSVKSMGEGTNKLLNLALALYNCKNGFLLIDEFENGLYYRLQDEIWDKVFMIAEKLKIQVFASTHSLDTVYSFINSMENHKKISSTVFRMAEIDTKIEAIEYDVEELLLTKNQKLELR